MKRLGDILIFWFKVMAIVFALTSVIAFGLLLFVNNVTISDRLIYALLSGISNGLILGTLIALYMGWKTWRVVQSNRRILARKEKAKQP